MRSSACAGPEFAARDHRDGSAFRFQVAACPSWPAVTTPPRQLTLAQPADEPEVIAEAALRLFHPIWRDAQAVRLIGVGVRGLGAPPRQRSLWAAPPAPPPEQRARQQRVEAALAAIQARFGAGAVRRGSESGEP